MLATRRVRLGLAALGAFGLLAAMAPAAAQPNPPGPAEPPSPPGQATAEAARVAAHWTPARRAAAVPRDLLLDTAGAAYLRTPAGVRPYGDRPQPQGKPIGGQGDTTPPSVSTISPTGPVTSTTVEFVASATDVGGIRSVTVKVGRPGARAQSFSTSPVGGDRYSVTLNGLSAGDWTWSAVAKDLAGNSATTPSVTFAVDTAGSGGSGGDVVTNAAWTSDGAVQTAAGRIYFEMPTNRLRTKWSGFVCSGTTVTDAVGNASSVILTAAHCVYDDAYKSFARNVIFIPNQDGTTAAGTDRDCSNDPLGCWVPSHGVVDQNWTTRTFPDNVAWDYAYYVVPAVGARQGRTPDAPLESAASTLPLPFGDPAVGEAAWALGYSYSDDPNFMYCTQPLGDLDAANWWLSQCGLSGGASGGPWLQSAGAGSGPIFSVNSWGYTNQPGMAGPKLTSTTSAACLFATAQADGLAAPTGCPAVSGRLPVV